MMKIKNRFLRVVTISIACCFTTIGFSQTDKEIEETEKEGIRVSYMNYLHDQGYKPEVDDDGDVKFNYEGKTYFLFVKTNRVFTLVRFLNDENACSEKIQKIISKTISDFYNITIYTGASCDRILFSSRSFLKEKDDWKDFFTVSLSSVRNSIQTAKDYYSEE